MGASAALKSSRRWHFDSVPPDFLTDTFTDTAGTLLSAHAPELGGPWVIHPTLAGTVNIDPTGHAWTNSGSAIYYATATPPTANYHVTCQVDKISSGGTVRVFARLNDTDRTAYAVSYNQAAGELRLEKFVAAAFTLLGSQAIAWPDGETHTIAIEAFGNTINSYFDDILQTQVIDADIIAPGHPGLGGAAGADATGGYHATHINAYPIIII